MSLPRVYGLALHLLPAELRRKHGAAMEALFAREVEHAWARGWPHGVLAGAAGVLDVVQRGVYEFVRPERTAPGEHYDSCAGELFNMNAHGPGRPGDTFGGNAMKGIHPAGSPMPLPTTGQLLRRHAASFTVAFVMFTAFMLWVFASRQMPALSARGASVGTMAELVLLALPFTAAMTIPMAVFVAVVHQFTRLGADGTLVAARQMRHGVRRLVVPVLAAATGVTALAFVVAAEIVPRSNERLQAVLTGGAVARGDRSMTISQLREAARNVGPGTEPAVLARAAGFEVEVQKKFALPAACLVLALAGMALAFRMPRGGTRLVLARALCASVRTTCY